MPPTLSPIIQRSRCSQRRECCGHGSSNSSSSSSSSETKRKRKKETRKKIVERIFRGSCFFFRAAALSWQIIFILKSFKLRQFIVNLCLCFLTFVQAGAAVEAVQAKQNRLVDAGGGIHDVGADKQHHRKQQQQQHGVSRFEQWDWKKVISSAVAAYCRRIYLFLEN